MFGSSSGLQGLTHGSEHAIKAAGKMQVEGREYVMRDSDVAHFLVATK